MKILYFLAPLMALSFFASAQSNYKPGYYVSLQGDTVRGVIDYREWDLNPETVYFKTDTKATDRRRLDAAAVRAFNIQDAEQYQGFTGRVTADNLGNNNGRDTAFTERSVFLKLITRGDKIGLFEYRDAVKTRFFVSADGNTSELIYRSYRQDDQTVDERTYRKQLSVIALQHNKLTDAINKLIQRTDYTIDNLTRVAKTINDVTDNTQEASSPKASSLGFYAGLNANITMYKMAGVIKDAGAPDRSSILPGVVAGMDIYANPRTRQLVLRVEAGALLSGYNGEYKSTKAPYNDVVYKFNQLNVFASPQILYNFYNSAGFKFYLGAGLNAALVSYNGKEFRNVDGSSTTLAYMPFNSFIGTATTAVFKAGVLVNRKIEVNASYTTPNDISQDPYYSMNSTTIHLGVNYHFR